MGWGRCVLSIVYCTFKPMSCKGRGGVGEVCIDNCVLYV